MNQNLINSTEYICNKMDAVNHSKNSISLKNQLSKLLFIGIVMLSFFIVGCKEEDEDKTSTTVAEDKANIQASFNRTKNLLESFKNGSFYKFVDDFIDYQSTAIEEDYYTYYESSFSEFTKMLVERLGEIVDKDEVFANDKFNFANLAGKYEWNMSDEKWDKTQNSAILVSFPSSKDKKSNDCEAAITAYEDTECNIEGDKIYLPTKVNIYLKQGSEKIFSTDVTASFSNYGIPKDVAVNVYANPFKFGVSLKQDSPSKFKAEVSVADENKAENNLSISCEANLASDLNKYSDLDDMDLNSLKLTVRQHELSIDGTVDFKSLNDLKITTENINEHIHFEVFYKTQKVGTLKVVDGKNDDRLLYIVYKDSSQENTSIYYEKFINDIKELFKDYLD